MDDFGDCYPHPLFDPPRGSTLNDFLAAGARAAVAEWIGRRVADGLLLLDATVPGWERALDRDALRSLPGLYSPAHLLFPNAIEHALRSVLGLERDEWARHGYLVAADFGTREWPTEAEALATEWARVLDVRARRGCA